MKSKTLMLLSALALVACGPVIQTTSGSDFVARGGSIDAEIRKLASVEPNLKFPARIGVARIVNGQLSAPSEKERAALTRLLDKHRGKGEWVPISPLVAGLVNETRHDHPVKRMRRAAARQHLDYLLVYELGARGNARRHTPFALADVTIIGGMLLPTRVNSVTGIGAAAFVDTRNGYTYGHSHMTKDLTGLARSWYGDQAERRLREKAVGEIARDLMPEIDEMLVRLGQAQTR
ncbi:MAG: hypothetical protein OIF48_20380 [Silicimonas sp.]|nr:hypothetical protein [Silicimonas sp.]